MSGTKAGGIKAAAKNKELYGEDFYKQIGKKGGKNGHDGGFASVKGLAEYAGRIGGRHSTRRALTVPRLMRVLDNDGEEHQIKFVGMATTTDMYGERVATDKFRDEYKKQTGKELEGNYSIRLIKYLD